MPPKQSTAKITNATPILFKNNGTLVMIVCFIAIPFVTTNVFLG
jgi:hypothetical protein